jgi:hypothetical protein
VWEEEEELALLTDGSGEVMILVLVFRTQVGPLNVTIRV